MGPRLERHILVKRASMSGLLIFDYATVTRRRSRASPPGSRRQARYREDILDGIEACPGAIAALYRGENSGKLLVRLKHG